MSTVVITSWSTGFESAKCALLLHSFAGLSQSEAKKRVEDLLKGGAQEVTLKTAADARMMTAALAKLGATAHIKAESP